MVPPFKDVEDSLSMIEKTKAIVTAGAEENKAKNRPISAGMG